MTRIIVFSCPLNSCLLLVSSQMALFAGCLVRMSQPLTILTTNNDNYPPQNPRSAISTAFTKARDLLIVS